MHRHPKVVLLAGVVGAARTHAMTGNTGDLSGCQGDLATAPSGVGARRQLLLPVSDNYFCRRRASERVLVAT